ncbi:MAG: hypothetical protein MRY83_15610 [Flavobacteriales bacterium]|nr:hypothetical protein [Flavobacteriales bacterium]
MIFKKIRNTPIINRGSVGRLIPKPRLRFSRLTDNGVRKEINKMYLSNLVNNTTRIAATIGRAQNQ